MPLLRSADLVLWFQFRVKPSASATARSGIRGSAAPEGWKPVSVIAEPFSSMVKVVVAELAAAAGALACSVVRTGAADTAPVERASDKVRRTALVFKVGLMCV
ncbi:hypothetical protein D3C73_1229700 [compost metagenome]